MPSSIVDLFTSYARLLEFENGSAITPELIWLALLTIYLVKESRRRGLRWYDWLSLLDHSKSMNFILAIYICDLGVCIRSTTIWLWRLLGAGEFSAWQNALLTIGGALLVLGFLCKIRALTAPDGGDRPWFLAGLATAIVALLLLVAR